LSWQSVYAMAMISAGRKKTPAPRTARFKNYVAVSCNSTNLPGRYLEKPSPEYAQVEM
jgi:hypothetical protein